MTTKKSEFAALAARAVESGALRKLVLSRPRDGAPVKVTGRAVALRGGVAVPANRTVYPVRASSEPPADAQAPADA